jgi:hypothetical protein
MIPDALGTFEHEYGRAKYENGTRRPPYRRKRVLERKTGKRPPYRRKRVLERKTGKRDTSHSVPSKMSPGEQNMKNGPATTDAVENESECEKHENGT